jgi:hypothetical protein
MNANPLLNILDTFLAAAGSQATPLSWLAHIQDATTLQSEVLLDVYSRRIAQRNAYIRSQMRAQPSGRTQGICIS